MINRMTMKLFYLGRKLYVQKIILYGHLEQFSTNFKTIFFTALFVVQNRATHLNKKRRIRRRHLTHLATCENVALRISRLIAPFSVVVRE